MPLGQVTTIQLTAVRALLERAASAVAEGGPVGATVAMLLADVALETLLKQSLADLSVEMPRYADVHDLTLLFTKAKPALATCPEAQVARRMRGARNPVQHSGFAPNEATVAAHLRDAEGFANLVTREVYGVGLAEVSLAALLRDQDLRGALERARDMLGRGEVDDASIQVAAAFGLLFSRCGSWIRLIMGVTDTEERFTAARAHPAVLHVFPSHAEGVTPNTEHESWRETTLVSLGLPLPDLLSLKGVEMRAEAVLDARKEGRAPPDDPPTVDALLHVIDVLTRHIWRIETAAPTLVAGGVQRDSGA